MTCTLMKIARKGHNFSRKDTNHTRTRYTKNTPSTLTFLNAVISDTRSQRARKKNGKKLTITRYDIKDCQKK